MTDWQVNRDGRGRNGIGQRLAGSCLAVLLILTPAGCGIKQEPYQGQPERIGSVAHRDRGEEEAQELSADNTPGDSETENGTFLEEGAAEEREDVLHLGQITASGEEGGEAAELTFRIVGEEAGLPQEAADQIARINKGEPLWEVVGSDYLKDYYALTGTHTIKALDKGSGQEAVGAGRLTMYVPNLLEGLTDIAALFYDNAAGEWCLIQAEQVNMEKRTVSMILTGSGTLTVIHKRQEETKD